MPRNSAIGDLWWTVADHDYAGHVAAPINGALGAPLRPPRPQTPCQLSTEFPASLNKEGLIDRFVTHAHLRFVRVIQP